MNTYTRYLGIVLSAFVIGSLSGCAASAVKSKYTAIAEEQNERYTLEIEGLQNELVEKQLNSIEVITSIRLNETLASCGVDKACQQHAYKAFLSELRATYDEADFGQVLLYCNKSCTTPQQLENAAMADYDQRLQARIEQGIRSAEQRHGTILADLNAEFQREYALAKERDRQTALAFSQGLQAASQSYQQAYQSAYSSPTYSNSYYGGSSYSNSTSWSSSPFTYYSGDVSGTTQTIGNFQYHNFNNGLTGTTQNIGNFSYHNFNNGFSGTTQNIGNFQYHNYNDGVSGTTQNIGNFDYTNFSDGTRCTTQHIGSMAYTNCN